jgi:tetratricopeptide (TPR) repeat protein
LKAPALDTTMPAVFMKLTGVLVLTFLAACSASAARPPLNTSTQARYDADLASVHLNYGRAEEAARLYREAIALEESPAEKALYHQGLAQALGALQDPAGARQELDKALALYESLIRNSAAEAAQFLERYVRLAERPRAKKTVDGVVDAHAGTTDIQVLVWLANVYLALESPEEALGLYRRAEAAASDPVQKGKLTLARALLLARLRKNDEAEALLTSLSKDGPGDVAEAARKSLLQFYASQGRTDKIQLVEKK